MKKVVLFVRVSTQRQEVDSQIEALKRNALVDGFGSDDMIIIAKKESGVSLKEAEREGLNELKKVIEENDIDCVYIYELSRLSRDPMTLYSVRDGIFKNNKIQLKCIKPAFSLLEEPDRTKFDTMGSLVFSIFGCFAEQEAVEKKERFHRGKKHNAIEGKYNGGTIPYGYEVDDNRDKIFVVNQEEASNIHIIFDLYESGYTISRIVQELHERGLKCRSHKTSQKGLKKDFDVRFVHQLLTAELLTGRQVNGSNTAHIHSYPPIISETQFDKCREIARGNSTFIGKVKNVYLAKSLLVCPDCGSVFGAQVASSCYLCKNAIMSEKWRKVRNVGEHRHCQNRLSISINALDSLLWYITIEKECEYLLGSALSDKAQYEEQIAILREKINAINPRLEDLESKRSRIIDSYIDGEITKEEKVKKSAELEEQRQSILKQNIEYTEKIDYYHSRIEDIKNLYSMEGLNAIDVSENIHSLVKVREKIGSITNEEEKYRLVHKHIKSLMIEERTIIYALKSNQTKEAKARYLTVSFKDGEMKYFYFLPYDGYGGHWINSDSDGEVLDKVELTIELRYGCQRQKAFRLRKKEEKDKAFEAKYPKDRLYLRTYSEMSEYFGMSKNSLQRRCEAGFFQDALTKCNQRTHMLDAERALEIMRASDNSYIKRIVEKFDAKQKKEGES